MALLVKKFGGTSVANLDCMQQVARLVLEDKKAGHDVVVVLSAMAGNTNQLVALAKAISKTPNLREYDALISTGENQSIALMSILLNHEGCSAQSLTAAQVRILTSNDHKYAQIKAIETNTLKRLLAAGTVPIVAGFQGVDEFGDITTLDRGGSDATAVALSYALNADECQIYTDVDGVYSADPNLIKPAIRIPQLSHAEMLEMADSGAKVLQNYAVQIAKALDVPLRVKSTFKHNEGTLLSREVRCQVNEAPITAVSHQGQLCLLSFSAQSPGRELQSIIEIISSKNIKIQHISQQFFSHGLILNLVIHCDDLCRVQDSINDCLHRWPQMKLAIEQDRAEAAIIGQALNHNHFLRLQAVLATEGVIPDLILSTPQKISLIFNQKALRSIVSKLHQHFIETQ